MTPHHAVALRARVALAVARRVNLAQSDDDRVRALLLAGGTALATLAAQLVAGSIAKADFIEQATAKLGDAMQTAGTIGGGDALDADSLDSLLDDRTDDLDGFADDVAGGDLSVAQIAQRANLWAGLIHTAWQMGRADGARADGKAEATWKLDPGAQHCDDCVALAEGSPYPIDDLPTDPGAGDTACLGNCRCEWSFSGTSSDEGD